MPVALHTEGVDRNLDDWTDPEHPATVALHTEGVDRNPDVQRAYLRSLNVALHTEGVDRNQRNHAYLATPQGRPPHGGRG